MQLNLILNQAVLLQELEGKQAADLYMDEIYQRFPYHFGLMQEYIQWIRERPVEETLAVIRSAIECHPYDAWLYRELGFNLIEVRELYKGLECAELAGKIEPQNTAWMYLKGLILWQMQRDEEAESLLKDALRIDVGNRAAMSLLVKIHDEIEGKRDSLRFVRNELKRQVIQGDAVLTFRLLAEHALPGEELLEELREIHKHRSDLWETYCALGKQLLVVQKMDEAIEILKAGAEKFPLIPRLSLELGQALNLSGQSDAAIQAYQQGLKVNAGYSDIIRQLADIHVKRGENEEAQKLIRSAINQNPRNGINYGWLADLLWEAGQHEDALNEIEKAVELQVDYAWAWGKFQHWCTQEKQLERVLEAARKCTREYPGRVSVWQNLAELLTKDEQREERDAALATALKLDPRDVNLLDDRARYIANEGNYDAAIQICEQAREQGALPSQLKIRLGWIFRKQRKFEEGYAEVMSGLEDDPNHYNAWMMIAEWAREDNRNDLYERASEELVRIEPYSEMSFGHLGEAYERNGKEDQAIKCYERAVEIQPNYIFGLMANFDLELKAKNLAAAQLKWNKLEGVSQTQFVYAREIQLAGLLKDAARVKAAFQKTFVCVNENKEEPEWWPVDIAIQTMREVQLHNDLEQMLRQQMEQHESRIYMQGYLVNKKINDKYNLVDEFKSWINKDQRFRWMVYEWFRILIDSNFKVTFFEFINKNKKWITSDSLLSAFVCYGVNRYLDFKAGLPFAKVCMMHQDELEPWMLVNISEVFANYADYSRVVDVCTLALEKPKDHHEECIRIMKACSELLLDQKESAHNSLGAINYAGMRSEYALAGLLCRDLIDFEKMSAEEQLQRFKISRQQLDSIIKNYRYLQQEPMRLKLLHRYVNHAIWKQKSLSAKWWGISTKMKLVMGMM